MGFDSAPGLPRLPNVMTVTIYSKQAIDGDDWKYGVAHGGFLGSGQSFGVLSGDGRYDILFLVVTHQIRDVFA